LGQQPEEIAVSSAENVPLIITNPWFCTTDGATCSSVIGEFITYRDQSHITSTYAQYLASVVGTSLSSLA
jgi:hypothetical protein